MREYVGDFKEEVNSIDCLWEIETEDSEIRGKTLAIEKGENRKITISYKLRHFLTGRILCVEIAKDEKRIPVIGPHVDEKGGEETDKNSQVTFSVTDVI